MVSISPWRIVPDLTSGSASRLPPSGKLRGSTIFFMGLTHCPLCIGLAVVAALRFCAHGWLLVASGLLAPPPPLPLRRHPVLWVGIADR